MLTALHACTRLHCRRTLPAAVALRRCSRAVPFGLWQVGWDPPPPSCSLAERWCGQVAAACLYIICRQESKPFMLIDFSDALQLNVFMLGAVFMSLCKALHMEELPMFQR